MVAKIAMIAAVDLQLGIGYKNDLLYKFKEDMKLFKDITTNNVVVMGRNTWLSLPENCRPLKNRINYVLSDIELDLPEDVKQLRHIMDIADLCTKHRDKTIFIIGGASLYNQMMSHADELYITHIDKKASHVDTFFPVINEHEWIEENATPITDYAVAVKYVRKNHGNYEYL